MKSYEKQDDLSGHTYTLPEAYDHEAYAATTQLDLERRALQGSKVRGDLEKRAQQFAEGRDWRHHNPLLKAKTPTREDIEMTMGDFEQAGAYDVAEQVLKMRDAHYAFIEDQDGEKFAKTMQDISYRISLYAPELKRFF